MIEENQNKQRYKLLKLLNLSKENEDTLSKNISFIKLKSGERLNRFGDYIPGVLFQDLTKKTHQ